MPGRPSPSASLDADAPTPYRTSPPTGPRTPRRLSWDALRVGFVLLVILYHATWIGPNVYRDLIPRNAVFSHQVGASLLLVLSAYFVAATLRPGAAAARSGAATARWWWGRIARLLPPFAVATVLAWWFLRDLAPAGWFLPTKHDLLWNLLMLWNWNGVGRVEYVDGSYWTVPVQLLAFTLAALLTRTRLARGRPLRVLLWGAVLVALAQWPLRVASSGTVYASFVDGLGVHRWHLFVAGVTVWMLGTGRLRRPHAVALLVVCVLAHAVQSSVPDDTGRHVTDPVAVVLIALGLAAMVAAALGPDWDRLVPAPAARAVTWLAGISYGMFLVHQTVGYVTMRRLQDLGVGPTLQTAAMVATAVGLGWVLTRVVERPAHAWLVQVWDQVWDRAAGSYPGPPEGSSGSSVAGSSAAGWSATRS